MNLFKLILFEISQNKSNRTEPKSSFFFYLIYCLYVSVLSMQAREFANELRASTKASRNPTVWLDASAGAGQTVSNADTSAVSDAYAKMLTIFVPLLVDEVIISKF